MPILLYKSGSQEGLHYMDMFDRKLVKIDYYKCVLFLFPVVELSQRLDVGKSQPDIMEQKSMDYG